MNFEIIYSPAAVSDLDRVWDEVYEASQSFDIADRYITDLRAAISKKRNYPKTGTPLSFMGEFTGIYYVTFKEYIALYRINENRIEIGRILFARSDYMKTLFGTSTGRVMDTIVDVGQYVK